MKKPPNGNSHKNDNRQQAFIEHYLTCWNASEAARRAGYSPQTAQEQSSRLLSNVIIRKAIAARIAELKASADEVLLRLASHSRGTMDDFVTGEDIDLDRARERGKMHLVKKFKVIRTSHDDFQHETREIELYDAQAATVQLAKILNQYPNTRITLEPSATLLAALNKLGLTLSDVANDPTAISLFAAAGISVSIGDETLGAVGGREAGAVTPADIADGDSA